jgi:hypothetical protein
MGFVCPEMKNASVTQFLREALAHFASFGIRARQTNALECLAYLKKVCGWHALRRSKRGR